MARRDGSSEGSGSGEGASTVRRVSVAELKAALDAGSVPVLVDVRTPFEYGGGHVPGAINLPVGQVEGAELPDDVWLICRSGARSARAAQALAARGKRVVDVAGGTTAWAAAGYPSSKSERSAWFALVPPLLASLTLGLAPFVPEPHLVGKLRWVAGGAHGMGTQDWLDLAMHGAPWVWLGFAVARMALAPRAGEAESS